MKAVTICKDCGMMLGGPIWKPIAANDISWHETGSFSRDMQVKRDIDGSYTVATCPKCGITDIEIDCE